MHHFIDNVTSLCGDDEARQHSLTYCYYVIKLVVIRTILGDLFKLCKIKA